MTNRLTISDQTIKQVESELARATSEDYLEVMQEVLGRHAISRREWEKVAHSWMDRPHAVRSAKDSTLCRCGRYVNDRRGGIHLKEEAAHGR